jgi:hypothetical protein
MPPRTRFLLVTAVFVILLKSQTPTVELESGVPGVGLLNQTLMVALPIANTGTSSATKVMITSASLGTAPILSPASFPVSLGTIAADRRAVFQANFSAAGLAQNTAYPFAVSGTYTLSGVLTSFNFTESVKLPPASPGSAPTHTATVAAHSVSSAQYPHQLPAWNHEVNEARPPVPAGPSVPGAPTPQSTSIQPAGGPMRPGTPAAVRPATSVTFLANSDLGLGVAAWPCTPCVGTAAEPSGADGGGVILVSFNYAIAYSTDGGSTFTVLDPTTIFPPMSNDGIGFCCDQVVEYAPSIDRFIWLIQGTGVWDGGRGAYRLATASPSDIKSSGATKWTYWNLTPGVFGQPDSTSGRTDFDYPDLSIGTNYLNMNWDIGFQWCGQPPPPAPNPPVAPATCNSGREVVQVALSQIKAGGSLTLAYTTPSDSAMAWTNHLTKDTGNSVFWAANNGTSVLRVFSWAEGAGVYYWRDVPLIRSFATLDACAAAENCSIEPLPIISTATGPDWLHNYPRPGILGATRSDGNIWFAWTAGADSDFSQAHVEMVTLNSSYKLTQQVQVWNSSYAFGYPSLATNACTGEIGLSLESGGGGSFPNHVVGFWGDYEVYPTTAGNVGTDQFGDYVTIRRNNTAGQSAFFDAFGYALNASYAPGTKSVSPSNVQVDVQYAIFGRPGACTQ